jgi:Restriction alleviation protein Lar
MRNYPRAIRDDRRDRENKSLNIIPKACPFCAAAPELKIYDEKYYVRCTNESCTAIVGSKLFENKDDAVVAWNSRIRNHSNIEFVSLEDDSEPQTRVDIVRGDEYIKISLTSEDNYTITASFSVNNIALFDNLLTLIDEI